MQICSFNIKVSRKHICQHGLVIVLLFLMGTGSNAQQNQSSQLDKKTTKIFKKGLNFQKKDQNEKALKQFDKVLDKYPGHIKSMLSLAGIYYRIKQDSLSELYLLKAISIDSFYNPEMYFSLAMVQELQLKRAEARKNYELYVRFAPQNDPRKNAIAQKKVEQLDFVIYSMQHPVSFDPIQLGPEINTASHEYLASVNVSRDFMIFSRRLNRQEDLYSSQNVDGKWSNVLGIEELNTPGNEAAHCLSPDGYTLIFTSCDRRDGLGSCDLYESKFVNGIWSKPVNMGPQINSAQWDSQPSLSWDGKTLYFASTRLGGFGGSDIWFSTRNANGKWTKAQNAGKILNSELNEAAPFIHPNDFSLYFMSNGHLGMGGSDLFVSHRKGLLWSRPRNLGYPINTEADEGAMSVASDGITAFFSSDNSKLTGSSNRNLDIFSFQLHPDVQATPVSYVKGKVINAFTEEVIEADIILKDNLNAQVITELKSDSRGNFLTVLPLNRGYNFVINKTGFVFYSDHFDLNNENHEHYELMIRLIPVQAALNMETELAPAIVLKNIFFESGSSALDKVKSEIEIINLVNFLNENDTVRIQLNGHTDSIGNDEDNLVLSIERARAVYGELLQRGIQKDRLQYKGFGESLPIATNDTESGRQKNRRTEFVLQGKSEP
jgi:flagellar motor protein MotB